MSILEYPEELTKHIRASPGNVHCKLCKYFTPSILHMVNHVRRHHLSQQRFNCEDANIETYCCKGCDFQTELMYLFKQHIQQRHSVKSEHRDDLPCVECTIPRYICGHCPFETHFTLKWLRHTLLCLEKDRHISVLKQHMNYYFSERGIKWHQCKVCGYINKTKFGLQCHVNSLHLNEKDVHWYKCTLCTYKGKQKGLLRSHTKHQHLSDENIKWHECKECPFRSKAKTKLKLHMIAHLDEKDIEWFECEKCPYKCKMKKYLTSHMKARHTDEENITWFACEQCPYKSKWRHHLKKHINTRHLNAKNMKCYKCEECTHKTNMKQHLKSHMVAQMKSILNGMNVKSILTKVE